MGTRAVLFGRGADELGLTVGAGEPFDLGSIGVDYLANDDGDIVNASALQREFDEFDACEVDGFRAECGLDVTIGDHVGQSVAAQQVAVAHLEFHRAQVRIVVVAAEQCPQDQRSVRVHARLCTGQAAFVYETLDKRMVIADLCQLSISQPVGTGVSDVRHRELFAVEQQRSERRPHAFHGRVLGDELVKSVVGPTDRASERFDGIAFDGAVEFAHNMQGLRRGEVTGRGATHTIGKDQ